MDYTKDHKNRVNSLLMEKWGYDKKDEAIKERAGGGETFFHDKKDEATEEAEELEEMQGHPGKCCDMAHPDEEHEDYMARITIRLAEELPAEEEPAAEPEAEFGKSKIGGGEFRKASVATGKDAGAGGFTNRERGVVGDLQKKMVAAAEAGDIVTGKALKLAKIFAAELDALIAKGK